MRRHPDSLIHGPEKDVPEGVCAWCLEPLPRDPDTGHIGLVGVAGISTETFHLLHEECWEEWERSED